MPDQRRGPLPQENTENRAMGDESDTATPAELRAQHAAIARDPELADETPGSYENELDRGGETPSGTRTGADEAWTARRPHADDR